jgi:urease accessory protein
MNKKILSLLQLTSPSLPLGAYSYSEGLESLITQNAISLPGRHYAIASAETLSQWLIRELSYGAIRLEAAIMIRAYFSVVAGELQSLNYWNSWSSAAKESSELRSQSWQMGNSLLRLLIELQPKESNFNSENSLPKIEQLAQILGRKCNYSIAFGIGTAYWKLNIEDALLGYLQSWTANLISVGVRLIPLGQTTGQKLLLQLNQQLIDTATTIGSLKDDDLCSCSFGLGLASMTHQHQHIRLFRS